jgi:hypothetical protein
MDTKEVWNEICFILSDSVKKDIAEKDFENQVVRAIEKLGWSEYAGEIKRQPELQIGRGTVRPDIVLYDSNRRAVVALEVKRPLEDLSKEEPAGQLKSYMLQLKCEFGLLVGSSIRLFYDGKENPQQDPLLLSRIPFEKDLEKGRTLVSIFKKPDFLKQRYGKQIRQLIRDFTAGRNIRRLKQKLEEKETKRQVFEFLRTEFSEYGADVVEGAMKDLKIDLYFDSEKPQAKKVKGVDKGESLLKTVFDTIRSNENGIARAELVKITGYSARQIANAVYKLTKRGNVAIKERGVYIALSSSISPKPHKARKKKPVKAVKKESSKNAVAKGTLVDSVFKVIKRRKKGFTVEELRNETGLEPRQLSNALYKLSRRGLVFSKKRGLYQRR